MALLTIDLIGAGPPRGSDPLYIQGTGDNVALKLTQIIYQNLSDRDATLHVEALSKGLSQDFIIQHNTQLTTVNIPPGRQPDIQLGGPQGFRILGFAYNLE